MAVFPSGDVPCARFGYACNLLARYECQSYGLRGMKLVNRWMSGSPPHCCAMPSCNSIFAESTVNLSPQCMAAPVGHRTNVQPRVALPLCARRACRISIAASSEQLVQRWPSMHFTQTVLVQRCKRFHGRNHACCKGTSSRSR